MQVDYTMINERFGRTKTDTTRLLRGRICNVEIRVAGPDGINGLKTRSFYGMFVTLRFVLDTNAFCLECLRYVGVERWPSAYRTHESAHHQLVT